MGFAVVAVAGCLVVLTFIPVELGDPEVGKEMPFLNGVWVDAFNRGVFSDDEVGELVRAVEGAGINAVFLQVRRRGDLLIETGLEPKIELGDKGDFEPVGRLRGELDRLGDGVQLHAWVVCGPVWNRKSFEKLPSNHVIGNHPDWLMLQYDGEKYNEGEYYLELGHPGVQNHLVEVCGQLAGSGHFDGVHLDYIRYPGRNWGYHPDVVREFQELYGRDDKPDPADLDWMAFRRQKISDLVAAIYCRVKNVDPRLIVSAATITFAPGPDKPSDWFNTSAYGYLFQDWKGWLDRGTLDWAIPMVYFNEERHSQNYRKWVHFLSEWDTSSRIALGLGMYMNGPESNRAQYDVNLQYDLPGNRFLGVVGYSYANAMAEKEMRPPFVSIYPTYMGGMGLTNSLGIELKKRPEAPFVEPSLETGHLAIRITAKPVQLYGKSAGISIYRDGKLAGTTGVNAAGFACFTHLSNGDYEVVFIYKAKAQEPREVGRSVVRVISGTVQYCYFSLATVE